MPGSFVEVSECPAASTQLLNCSLEGIVTPRSTGSFDAGAVVSDTSIESNGTPVNCAARPGACDLVAVNLFDPAEYASVPLQFSS